MTERDELPEGWKLEPWSALYGVQTWKLLALSGALSKLRYYSERAAIAAAWRIVDAEREAADGH